MSQKYVVLGGNYCVCFPLNVSVCLKRPYMSATYLCAKFLLLQIDIEYLKAIRHDLKGHDITSQLLDCEKVVLQ